MSRTDAGTLAREAQAWWRALQPDPARGDPGDRAALAKLRRCGSVIDVLFEPAAQELARRCGARGDGALERIALVAGVLAHVRTDRPGLRVARRIGPVDASDRATALCKPIRFRRLLDMMEFDDCLRGFRRLVALADAEMNVRDLAEAVFLWPRPEGRGSAAADRIRVRWVYEYWNAGEPEGETPSDQACDSVEELQS
ncbi:type I-E CRISPR-associated protein Cse2/CasB [Gluconacetobacter takamatsuzukensis]|uniref:Type I-E CRISPR-associated protein Cse2/CasB n=1 Tax=Gluconacetobacter takamatsuzukensis TaxID=1286190 RepID=A0A7W4KAU0_9PROT|nr:type I-E CRISPR-associated protein Cse2/CasB [Gluconacetobacter takamatsuzukensis]MBB2203477.1 type I-E CRISPR-associated protein Cse2/CasB [Gluconacetobacter takamatsuzukensis]